MKPARAGRIEGYEPSIDVNCTVLVVGSMPSRRSLAAHEYYAHPQNRFWDFVEELFDIPRSMPHGERLASLRAHRVALWDVVQSCERETSADSDIRSVQPNDFVGLLRRYPAIARVFCNGGKAFELWRRWVEARVTRELGRELLVDRLPSTSPAHASLHRAEKLAAWSILRTAVGLDC